MVTINRPHMFCRNYTCRCKQKSCFIFLRLLHARRKKHRRAYCTIIFDSHFLIIFYHNKKITPTSMYNTYRIGGYDLIIKIFNVGCLCLMTAYSTKCTTLSQLRNIFLGGGGDFQVPRNSFVCRLPGTKPF